jgi:hypothetical protein
MRQALEHLEPYFEMRNANGRTFFRSDKRRQQQAIRAHSLAGAS